MAKVTKQFKYGDHLVTLETGEIARQATAAVMVSMGDTVVLVTAVGDKKAKEGRDFFPLTINYQEKFYAGGRIPGGFFKREGRPTERETLTSRLIDRPIRPLFPDGFFHDVQVMATVLSMNPDIDADIPALIGASAALSLSGLPFAGPIGAAKVGYANGKYLLNPTTEQLKTSQLELVVAGTDKAVLMVESEAQLLSEEVMLGAVMFGHRELQAIINAIRELVAEVGVTPFPWNPPTDHQALDASVKEVAEGLLNAAYDIREKQERRAAVSAAKTATIAALGGEKALASGWTDAAVVRSFDNLEYALVRHRIIAGRPRIDGRDSTTIRPISVRAGLLPRTHGSALFTRGETQAIVTVTLGTSRDAQIIDAAEGESKETFMMHYNFPPFSVGEISFMLAPKRREIGHGRLAKRGVAAVMPKMEDFPYVVRVVSEITESNGSSSMASVCGSSLALMDAGVPVKAPVAGIAMGLVKEGDKYVVLSDILGDEDHLGDMDFKVAGTSEGVTALQMDIKIHGVTKEIMRQALKQAREGRLHILDVMNKTLNTARGDISAYAPRIVSIKVRQDKIRDIIGPGGKVIRGIVEETGCKIDIEDDGTVFIASSEETGMKRAIEIIEGITMEAQVGKIYKGKVVRIVDFGAFVEIMPGTDGLLHISQIGPGRVHRVSDVLKEGDEIQVKVLEIDKSGKIRLSRKEAMTETGQPAGGN